MQPVAGTCSLQNKIDGFALQLKHFLSVKYEQYV